MTEVRFKQVDVFTNKPFLGNPVAVILDGSGLSSSDMQAIANWTNLSETTFVLPATNPLADYRVRIFTPESELPFAGHPTIGTALAVMEEGLCTPKDGKLLQECHSGLIPVLVSQRETGINIAFELPDPKITMMDEAQIAILEFALNCPVDRTAPPIIVDVGPRWVVVKTKDAATVRATEPKFEALREANSEQNVTGVCVYGHHDEQHLEVRTFAPACGVQEDPVCGSGNGSVAAFLRYYSLTFAEHANYTVSQGSAVGRKGVIELMISEESIYVSGHAVTCVDGRIVYPAAA